ncbi:MAG: GNAT family N-acetyltransferase [Actinobacteria bacterium]|nr:GNAT family N-acetyltransferase [Actinomycetota bacterium]
MIEFRGYADPLYAHSLSEFGRPRELPHSGSWILERAVPKASSRDAMGCYPLFVCSNWHGLRRDISDLRGDLLSLVVVSDPFADDARVALAASEPELLRSFKQHYAIDLALPINQIGQGSRRRKAARAAERLDVERATLTPQLAQDWIDLYSELVQRRGIRGIPALTPTALATQLEIPGATIFTASRDGILLAAQVCYPQGDVVHCHLAAASNAGYQLGALPALVWLAVEHYRTTHRWLNLGGGAGTSENPSDGLSLYKASWATHRREAWLAGFILDRGGYQAAVLRSPTAREAYFPAYRAGEFA